MDDYNLDAAIERAEERWIDSLSECDIEDDNYDDDYEYDTWRDIKLMEEE